MPTISSPGLTGRLGLTDVYPISPLFAPDILSLGLFRGQGSAGTSIRNSTGTFKQPDIIAGVVGSIIKTAEADQHRVENGREVVNLLSYPEDLTNAAWVTAGTAATPDAQTLNLPAELDTLRQEKTGMTVGTTAGFLLELSGDGTVSIRLREVGGSFVFLTTVQITLTSSPKKYYITATLVNAADTGFNAYISRLSGDTATSVTITKAQLEDVTGQANQNPSEYVGGSGAGPFRRIFDTTNGNTVSSNVVVEAAGVSLHPKVNTPGVPTYATYPDWPASTAVVVGDTINLDGYWHTALNAGTTGASEPAVIAPLNAPELITNGGFDADTDWTKGTGWTIAGGVATHASGTQSDIEATGSSSLLTSGKHYMVVFTVSGRTAGTLTAVMKTGGESSGQTTNGTFSVVLAAGTGNFVFRGTSAFDGSIDDISVREVTADNGIGWRNDGYYSDIALLVEGASTNEFLYSDEFDNAAWSKFGTSVTANTTLAPDGTTTADTITGNGIGTFPTMTQAAGTISTDETVVYYVKEGTSTHFLLRIDDLTNVTHYTQWFDWVGGVPVAGTAPTSTLGTATTHVEKAQNGFYRVSLSVVPGTTGGNKQGSLYLDWNAATTKTLIVWRGQLESSPVATSPIQTTTAAVTRATEQGNLQWNQDGNIDITKGTIVMGVEFGFDESLMSSGNYGLLSINTLATSGLYHSFLDIKSYDGVNIATTSDPAWLAGDVLYAGLRWDVSTSKFQTGYLWASKFGQSWVWGTETTFDGSLLQSGTLIQLFVNQFGPVGLRFLHTYRRDLGTTEIERRYS